MSFFQPSPKLASKHRDGSAIHCIYDVARTPWQRLLATDVLAAERRAHLERLAHALDPVRLLRRLDTFQEALWRHAVFGPRAAQPAPAVPAPNATTRFETEACDLGGDLPDAGIVSLTASYLGALIRVGKGNAPAAVRQRIEDTGIVLLRGLGPRAARRMAPGPRLTALRQGGRGQSKIIGEAMTWRG